MPTFAEENIVMWRGYAHLVPLMDLLRLRTAGWVIQSIEDDAVHLGVLHAAEAYDTPQQAARHLDMQAAIARQERELQRSRHAPAGAWVHADPPRHARAAAEEPAGGRVTTSRARRASRRASRRFG